MSRLDWSDPYTHFFEAGVDQVVLYVDGAGVAWSGVSAITESPTGGEAKPFYFDGFKYSNLSSAEEFEATIEAFGAPLQFALCDGKGFLQYGLFADQQPRKKFGLSYRTKIGSATDPELGYKIHLVYGCLADPSDSAYTTIGAEANPTKFSWHITTMPQRIPGLKPTAHFIVDTRVADPAFLSDLEDMIYGSDANSAFLPTALDLVALFS